MEIIFHEIPYIFNTYVEVLNPPCPSIFALREYTHTVKYIKIPALSGMGTYLE